MKDIKEKIMQVLQARARKEEIALGGKYAFRMATFSIRLAMEKEFPGIDWKCAELRKALTELESEDKVLKCPFQSRKGQAVWKLLAVSDTWNRSTRKS